MHCGNSLGTSASPEHAPVSFPRALDSTQLYWLGGVHGLALYVRQIFLFYQRLLFPVVCMSLDHMTSAVYLGSLRSHLPLLDLASINLCRLHRWNLGAEYTVPWIAELLRNQVTRLLVQILSNLGATYVL